LGVTSGLRVGAPADFIGLDAQHPALVSRSGDALLDSWVFATRNGAVDGVWRRGRKIVSGGRHHLRDAITARFRLAMSGLLAA
jgi:cytosine/adenosine deaminase-related metal-dependent hydrolase